MFEGLFQPMLLLVIALITVVVFGPRRIPELGKGIADGIREFKKSLDQLGDDRTAEAARPQEQTIKPPSANPM
jgi:sec-independent protein translocase protein TatA